MPKSDKWKVWKFKIGKKVDPETVEAALEEACGEVMQKAYREGPYGLIERIDIREKETTVFISGNTRTASAFSKTFRARVPRTKMTLTPVAKTSIMKFK